MSEEKLLEIRNLQVQFNTDRGPITAVKGVDLDVYKGKTLGIVGESGSGKSVTALSIMRLIPDPPGKIINGYIKFKGKNLLDMSLGDMRTIRGNKIAMIFQEPMTSLNPVFTVGNQIIEVLDLHQSHLSKEEKKNKAINMLDLVGIPAPEKRIKEYPHQLSGGMRQRVMIAMALACEPDILIADEPTTALDVTIQAQILELMNKLKEKLGMGIIFITHDLGVVAEMCDDVAVMYCGRIVEASDVSTVFKHPFHPYTKGLMESIPSFDSTEDETKARLKTIEGMVPSLFDLPKGCSFQDRCPEAIDECRGKKGPPLLEEQAPGHQAACFNPLK
ncbi:MAG: peptide ABC transporter ATP-binding protein [Epsilonproteobacteria bacterium]|nr:MAG: peptide ABC transporter ATP-binding protein [Campylobacterota bacterium]RLA67911.1 MAG: peptide ABC transporter ATP-binding protein [Campylobacterota bacterium]